MDGIDFLGYLVYGFLERTDVYGRGRDSVERQIRSLFEYIEAKDYRKSRSVIQYIAWRIGSVRCLWNCHACRYLNGGCPIEEKKIEVLR